MINFATLSQIAAQTAKASDVRSAMMGTVVFTNSGHVVTASSNRRLLSVPNRFTIHAEEYALAKAFKLNARRRMGDLAVLVVRIKRDVPGLYMAKPCKKCQVLLIEAGVQAYYSDEIGRILRLN